MKSIKKMIKEAILLSIESINDDICRTTDEKENIIRAEAILKLAEAYKKVNR